MRRLLVLVVSMTGDDHSGVDGIFVAKDAVVVVKDGVKFNLCGQKLW